MHHAIASELETDAYRRVLDFYGSFLAEEHPVLPRTEHGLIRIPCCLPDDESVVDRMALTPAAIAELWVDVWRRTHARGELFTMQVHPERIEICGPGVAAVLAAGAEDPGGVWLASLREIAGWWSARRSATVEATKDGQGRYRIGWSGPAGTTLLVRGGSNGTAWSGPWRREETQGFALEAPRRPFIGVHPERAGAHGLPPGPGIRGGARIRPSTHAVHLQRARFARTDERSLLDEIEGDRTPLVRMGRWPNGARSAVAVTGDVDALTIWDYVARFAGR